MARKRSTATRRQESEAASARAAKIRAEQQKQEQRRRTLVVGGVVAALLVLILGIGYAVQSSRDNSGVAGAAPAGVVGGGYAVPAGSNSAPVKVSVYEDFICPYCGQFEAAGRAQLEDDVKAGKLQIQYHVLNFLDRSSTTQYSTRAANALAVVLDKSGPTVAKKFHDLLFENQPAEGSAGLSNGQLADYAVQAGASRSQVTPGINDLSFRQWVGNVTNQASKAGVTGTPTVVIDGKKVPQESMTQLVGTIQQAVDKG